MALSKTAMDSTSESPRDPKTGSSTSGHAALITQPKGPGFRSQRIDVINVNAFRNEWLTPIHSIQATVDLLLGG